MIVDGYVKMSISMNVIGLETDAVKIDRYGRVVITDPDQFFLDWSDEWERGNGELSGASDITVELDAIEDEEEDEEDEEEDED
jgi:type IV secretory pathway TrbF-like protein